MKLYVVRHGETDFNKEERMQGSRFADEHLNATGREQITKLSKFIPDDIAVIFCSITTRTRDTAAILNDRLGKDILYRSELIERDFGDLSGKRWDEIDPKIASADLENKYDYRPYGGESVEQVRIRLTTFIEEAKTYAPKSLLVVTHRGLIRLLYDMYPDGDGAAIMPGTLHIFDI